MEEAIRPSFSGGNSSWVQGAVRCRGREGQQTAEVGLEADG
jgi:hypothetical protein